MKYFNVVSALAILPVGVLATSCKKSEEAPAAGAAKPTESSSTNTAPVPSGGMIRIDGSSSVFPITQILAEDFQAKNKSKVTVAESGTGGGFKKFCRGEIDINGASRPIKSEEQDSCKTAGINFIEIPIAYDGLSVVVHKGNTWVDTITVNELKMMWAPEAQAKITKWNQVRPSWPDKPLNLFGPGVDSGTYDYFTQAVVGKEHSSRGDFTSSEDDNVLVQGVSSDEGSLGFFGYAYYSQNTDKLKLVAVDDENPANGAGGILPSQATVADGTYQPLARPLFIYVTDKAMARPEISALVNFLLTDGRGLVKDVGYIPLPDKAYELALKRFTDKKVGTMFTGGSQVGVSMETLLSKE